MFSQATKDAMKADLANHPLVAAATATGGFNFTQLLQIIESIINAIIPLLGGATPKPPTTP